MEADLQNLVPAIGEVNGDRAHFRFGEVVGEPREYGACDFEVDRSGRVAEPRAALRGDIARAYLYMHYAYPGGLPLSATERRRFEQWHQADPPTQWERTRNRRIAAIQGGGNPLAE
jgi:deoxyribonuclease-1